MTTMTVTISYERQFRRYRLKDLKRKNCKIRDRQDIQVYIFSGQWRSFWRPDGSGYTRNISDAGVYTLAEAYRRTSHCGPEKEIYFLVKDQDPQC